MCLYEWIISCIHIIYSRYIIIYVQKYVHTYIHILASHGYMLHTYIHTCSPYLSDSRLSMQSRGVQTVALYEQTSVSVMEFRVAAGSKGLAEVDESIPATMYVCMIGCMYVLFSHIYTVWMYVCMYTLMSGGQKGCMYICMYVWCMYDVCMYCSICMYVCMYVLRKYVCMNVCMREHYVWIVNVYICIGKYAWI